MGCGLPKAIEISPHSQNHKGAFVMLMNPLSHCREGCGRLSLDVTRGLKGDNFQSHLLTVGDGRGWRLDQ